MLVGQLAADRSIFVTLIIDIVIITIIIIIHNVFIINSPLPPQARGAPLWGVIVMEKSDGIPQSLTLTPLERLAGVSWDQTAYNRVQWVKCLTLRASPPAHPEATPGRVEVMRDVWEQRGRQRRLWVR